MEPNKHDEYHETDVSDEHDKTDGNDTNKNKGR